MSSNLLIVIWVFTILTAEANKKSDIFDTGTQKPQPTNYVSWLIDTIKNIPNTVFHGAMFATGGWMLSTLAQTIYCEYFPGSPVCKPGSDSDRMDDSLLYTKILESCVKLIQVKVYPNIHKCIEDLMNAFQMNKKKRLLE